MLRNIAAQLAAMPGLELLAVLLAIAYLLLAARQSLWCWACAFASSLIFAVLFFDVSLLMDSALNIYYVLMAVYGWWYWRFAGRDASGRAEVRTISMQWHLAIVTQVLILSWFSGGLLAAHTDAAWPYVDSMTTWASVAATIMVARKIIENWLYWIVIDAVSVVLYLERGLQLIALLFAIYTLIAMYAWWCWRRDSQGHVHAATA